jgi:iron(III) transport system ATP-binding protein
MQDTVALPVPANESAPETPYLVVRGLVKRFGKFTALQNVSLSVNKGEFVCFLGPSGCGKTTLLRAIAGLDPQDEGTISIGGRDVSNLPPAARDFGIVFQSYALFPNLTRQISGATVRRPAAARGAGACACDIARSAAPR